MIRVCLINNNNNNDNNTLYLMRPFSIVCWLRKYRKIWNGIGISLFHFFIKNLI